MNNNKNSKGIIYTAVGDKKYLEFAEKSAKSVKKHTSDLKFCVCTDLEVDTDFWDEVVFLDKQAYSSDQRFLHKINTFRMTPFEKTLFLDSDTYVMSDISDVFDLLDNFDLGFTHGHNRQKNLDRMAGKVQPPHSRKENVTLESIPASFAPIQGGFLLYKKSKKIWSWLEKLRELYIKKNWYDDQVSIRELLWETDLKFYILPVEYNFNDLSYLKYWLENPGEATPKIFHYKRNKLDDIEKLVASMIKRYKPSKIKQYTKSLKQIVQKTLVTLKN